jgi:hypothetical protein
MESGKIYSLRNRNPTGPFILFVIFRKTHKENQGYIFKQPGCRSTLNHEMIMQSIRAFSVAPAAHDWMANTRHPHILHVFDQACNLINEQRELLSIVTPQIGNGPFNIVVEDRRLLSENLRFDSPVSIAENQLLIGGWTISMADAKYWSPSPDWGSLHNIREDIARQMAAVAIPNSQTPNSLRNSFPLALARGDISSAKSLAYQLAGAGMGLTPAGDDFILGALHAAWIIHPQGIAKVLGHEIAKTAAGLTSSLSAAWLKTAGRGEAGIRWHEFFSALIHSNLTQIGYTMDQILAIGATSGADALAGFIGTFHRFTEMKD